MFKQKKQKKSNNKKYQKIISSTNEDLMWYNLLYIDVNIKIEGNKMECVATDSYRLSKKIIDLENTVDNLINIA